MKNSIRSRISEFLKSEEGRVGAKSPLALGVASASILLAQAIVMPSAEAHKVCATDDDCPEGHECLYWCDGKWDLGTCMGTLHTHCEISDS